MTSLVAGAPVQADNRVRLPVRWVSVSTTQNHHHKHHTLASVPHPRPMVRVFYFGAGYASPDINGSFVLAKDT